MGAQQGSGGRLAAGLGWFSVGLGVAELAMPGRVANLIGLEDDNDTRQVLRAYGARELANGVAILASGGDNAAWLWTRVGGDALDLASLGKAMRRPDAEMGKVWFGIASVAGVMAADILAATRLGRTNGSAFSASQKATRRTTSIRVCRTFTINRQPDEVYAFWRQLEHLPRFMKHLESVEVDGRHSRWTAKGPGGMRVRWEAEMTEDTPEMIAWRSRPGATVPNRGTVRFTPAPGARGTELRVELSYDPPGGKAASTLARLFGREPEQQLDDDLRRVKMLLEAGEISQSNASTGWFKPGQPMQRSNRNYVEVHR